jgi:O-antigen/teichoic acid export membrane protein
MIIRFLTILTTALFVTRFSLSKLGFESYGLFHVVTGVVVILGFVNGALISSSQRNYAYYLEDNRNSISSIFLATFAVNLFFCSIFLAAGFILAEFLSSLLEIPKGLEAESNQTFKVSLIAFAFLLISNSCTALYIATSKYGLFAWLTFLDCILKIAAIVCLKTEEQIMLAYAENLLFAQIIMTIIHIAITFHIYEIRLRINGISVYAKPILIFSLHNMWGNLAQVLSMHGTNVVLNIGFGSVVNAARTVGTQVQTTVGSISGAFQMVAGPPLTRYFANEDYKSFRRTTIQYTKINFTINLFFSMCIFFNLNYLLDVWLVDYPPFTMQIAQILIFSGLINSLSSIVMLSIQATGNIALYQQIVGLVILMQIPAFFLLLNLGYGPAELHLVTIIIATIALASRLYFLNVHVGISPKHFISSVVSRSFLVSLFVYLMMSYIDLSNGNFSGLVANCVIILMIIIILSFFLLCSNTDRTTIITGLKKIMGRFT